MGAEIHPNKEAYENVWVLIQNAVYYRNINHKERFLNIKDNAKAAIWEKYSYFNNKCKEDYMSNDVGRLDRHKVCACYMYAILEAGLLNYKEIEGNDRKYLFDENIAISVGMSLLRSFIIEAAKEACKNQEISDSVKDIIIDRVDDGIVFPDTNHGNYRDNFKIELYYTKTEKTYNVLSLSNTLFLLETITLGSTIRKNNTSFSKLFIKR